MDATSQQLFLLLLLLFYFCWILQQNANERDLTKTTAFESGRIK